jgi:transketolase
MAALTPEQRLELQRTALQLRRNILRMLRAGKAGHVGGAMSMTDILTVLYFKVMRTDPAHPDWEDRDRFVLSAGHKCLGLYAALAEKGFFEKSLLDTYGALNSRLPGHPDMYKLPGVESNTGALGHGLSISGGMALGLRRAGRGARVFTVMGDGELAEGSNWEAAAAASQHKLENLLVFVDRNRFQIMGATVDVMSYEPLEARWASFGWGVRTIDGHDLDAIFDCATSTPFEPGKPSVVVADTIKARGLDFAEGKYQYHYWKATPEEMKLAEASLDRIEEALPL